MCNLLRVFLLLTPVLVSAGCGPTGPPLVRVTGTVTFDAQPVEDGEIIFLALDKQHGPDAGPIKSGKFELLVKAGKKRVEIRAAREMPAKSTAMGTVYDDYIPARYNRESTLGEEITPGGKTHFEYKLESTKK